MSAAKALAYALCDKLESKKVDEVVRNLVSSGWNIREVAWEASPFDHEMPYFDTGRDFDIGFPDTLSSKIEFLTANGSIVQARARLHFKQALIFAKASKHVAALKNSLDYYYGSSGWTMPSSTVHTIQYENAHTFAYMTRTISDGLDSVVYCVGNRQFWR